MAQARRFHAPGQGGRTGLRVDQEIDSLSGFFEAGKKAIRSAAHQYGDDTTDDGESDASSVDDHDDDYVADDRESQYETATSSRTPSVSSSQQRKSVSMGRRSAVGSSSMDIENSYAPSPNRTSLSRVPETPSPANDSVIDYGDDVNGDYDDDDRQVGPSSRPSLALSTPGAGRRRMSDFSPSRINTPSGINTPRASGRLSTFDATRPPDDSLPMDFMGDDDDYPNMSLGPSPDKGDASSYLNPRDAEDDENDDDEAGIAEGVYQPDDVQGNFDPTGDADEPSQEDSTQPVVKRKRGRPRKDANANSATASRRPPNLPSHISGHRIIERIPSSKGKAGTVMEGDVRRSTRHRIKPVDWWRGEHVVYARAGNSRSRRRHADNDGESSHQEVDPDDTIPADSFEDAPKKSYGGPGLSVRSVVRVERAPGEGTFAGMRIPTKSKSGLKGHAKGRARNKAKRDIEDGEEVEIELDPEAPSRHPEDGWDDNTDTHGVVWDVEQQSEVHRKIACPISRVKTKMAANSTFAFDKVFGVDEYMAAGVLEIPPEGEKPLKPTKDNNYVFVVLEGAVDVQIHRTYFRLAPSGTFAVPKGNTYAIRNVSRRTARIFFAQARQPHGAQRTAVATVNGVSVPSAGTADETIGDTSTAPSSSRAKNGKQPHTNGVTVNRNGNGNGNGNADASVSADSSSSSITPAKRPRGRPKKKQKTSLGSA